MKFVMKTFGRNVVGTNLCKFTVNSVLVSHKCYLTPSDDTDILLTKDYTLITQGLTTHNNQEVQP